MNGARRTRVDVLIVGSGLAGAAVARRLTSLAPDADVLVVDRGPQLTSVPGTNIRNLPLDQRGAVWRSLSRPTEPRGATPAAEIIARPGTTLLDAGPDRPGHGMPAAAMSTNVGGMGAHWTCACPRPGGSERTELISEAELDEALAEAEALLGVTTAGFQESASAQRVRVLVASAVTGLSRPVQTMPMACQPHGTHLEWAGTDRLLAPGESGGERRFKVWASTPCVQLVRSSSRVVGAVLVSLDRRETIRVDADVVVVAADSLRTPQLLWSSGVRLPALGRHLNDHIQIQAVAGTGQLVDPQASARSGVGGADGRDLVEYVHWVPFSDGAHPFSGTMMQLSAEAYAPSPGAPAAVVLSWFAPKVASAGDRLVFADDRVDEFGLPAIGIEYRLTEADRAAADSAIGAMHDVASTLGGFAPGSAPHLLPAGSSLHYQGTVRMGATDDGESVCDPWGQVWGLDNLFVAGNGVISTATACNPTLTTIAFAVRTASRIARWYGAAAATSAPRPRRSA